MFWYPSSASFQPTLPLRGATWESSPTSGCAGCFNPRSPCGERRLLQDSLVRLAQFQPTLPLRGATLCQAQHLDPFAFQPTLPLRGATVRHCSIGLDDSVSTHAPLAGSDHGGVGVGLGIGQFQPTLPLRGATPVGVAVLDHLDLVSTHAPLAGSDMYPRASAASDALFQPTLPLRGATILESRELSYRVVSTHAPLAGSDRTCIGRMPPTCCFNPRSPCGERPST